MVAAKEKIAASQPNSKTAAGMGGGAARATKRVRTTKGGDDLLPREQVLHKWKAERLDRAARMVANTWMRGLVIALGYSKDDKDVLEAFHSQVRASTCASADSVLIWCGCLKILSAIYCH